LGFHTPPSCGIVISVPLGRVPETLPGFYAPSSYVCRLLGVFLFLGIGFASKHGEFKLLGESRLFHNGTSMYAV
jgi:hypothetical protein